MKTKKINYEEYIGKKYGRLLVILKSNTKGKTKVLCHCDCGKEKEILLESLKTGKTKSCGCLRKENNGANPTHGKYKTRLYEIFSGIKQRCNNINAHGYKNYGGRGIKICDEWLNDFDIFYEWAINNGYDENLTIDRIDANGNYEPSNCRWANCIEQNNNKRNNRKVIYQNKLINISELSQMLKIPYATLLWRINNKWPECDWNIKQNLANKQIRKEGKK